MQVEQDFKKRQVDFIHWSSNYLGIELDKNTEKNLKLGLTCIGIEIDSIFSETDTQKLRLVISEFVLKRNHCGIYRPKEYLSVVNLLINYAEYLEKKMDVDSYPEIQKNKRKDTLAVAYYLSKADIFGVNALGYKNFSEAFKSIALIMNQKPATIKNMRDEFDPYCENGRKGWYQRAIRPSRKEIFDQYADTTIEDMTKTVKGILDLYKNKNILSDSEITQEKHKKLRIESKNMKEIKSKKK